VALAACVASPRLAAAQNVPGFALDRF